MVEIFIPSILYLVFALIGVIISRKLKFVDIPNHRKIHTSQIPNTSGLIYYFYLAILISIFNFDDSIETIIAIGSAVAFTGFLDDRINLTPGVKLILTYLPAGYLIFSGFELQNIGTYEFVGTLYLGKFSIIFSFLAVGLLINSYNYIDGIDGLLISTKIIGIIYLYFLSHDESNLLLFSLIIIALIINLTLNYLPKNNLFKVFMGDAGSLFIGYFMSFLIIFMYKVKNLHPAFLIWTCWYPVYDFIFVTFYRISKGIKFYHADKIHFHHYVLDKINKSHLKSTLLISLLNIIIIFIGYLVTKHLGSLYSLLLFFLLFIIFFIIRAVTLYRGVEQSGSSSGS